MTDRSDTGGGRRWRPPPGVVLDCDGVLVDSEPLHARATTEWAAGIGIDLSPEYFHDLVGMTVFDQIARIVEGTDRDPEASYRAREDHFWSLIDRISPMIGVVGLIHRLHAAGTRIAIASNGSRRYLQHVVEHLDVGGLVRGFICADDVTHPKPHPEPYQKAVALLDLPAARCVAVEDSAPGVTSAAAAGLSVIMISPPGTNPLTYPQNVQVATDYEEVERLMFGNARDQSDLWRHASEGQP